MSKKKEDKEDKEEIKKLEELEKEKLEDLMKQLETIAYELETSEISLEEQIEKFKLGTQIANICNKKLDEAEGKIAKLASNGEGNFIEVDMD